MAMKVKLFSLEAKNRKPGFDTFEAETSTWLADHPNLVIEHTNDLSQPSAAWSHLALAVWYSEYVELPQDTRRSSARRIRNAYRDGHLGRPTPPLLR
jgi:hypothetical protein